MHAKGWEGWAKAGVSRPGRMAAPAAKQPPSATGDVRPPSKLGRGAVAAGQAPCFGRRRAVGGAICTWHRQRVCRPPTAAATAMETRSTGPRAQHRLAIHANSRYRAPYAASMAACSAAMPASHSACTPLARRARWPPRPAAGRRSARQPTRVRERREDDACSPPQPQRQEASLSIGIHMLRRTVALATDRSCAAPNGDPPCPQRRQAQLRCFPRALLPDSAAERPVSLRHVCSLTPILSVQSSSRARGRCGVV
jgi:hypothetical protein